MEVHGQAPPFPFLGQSELGSQGAQVGLISPQLLFSFAALEHFPVQQVEHQEQDGKG